MNKHLSAFLSVLVIAVMAGCAPAAATPTPTPKTKNSATAPIDKPPYEKYTVFSGIVAEKAIDTNSPGGEKEMILFMSADRGTLVEAWKYQPEPGVPGLNEEYFLRGNFLYPVNGKGAIFAYYRPWVPGK